MTRDRNYAKFLSFLADSLLCEIIRSLIEDLNVRNKGKCTLFISFLRKFLHIILYYFILLILHAF